MTKATDIEIENKTAIFDLKATSLPHKSRENMTAIKQ